MWVLSNAVRLVLFFCCNVLTFMGLIREVGKVTVITNYVSGNNLFELVHDPEKKVWSAKYTTNIYTFEILIIDLLTIITYRPHFHLIKS